MADDFGNFLQWPLCLLARQVPFTQILNEAFSYAVAHYLDKTQGRDWRTVENRAQAIDAARDVMGFDYGDAEQIIAAHESASLFLADWEALGRTTYGVRMRTDIFLSAHAAGEERTLSERDFRVLAAVYSAIGAKPVAKIGWQGIQRRAAGLLSELVGVAAGPRYPRHQIEYTLKRLVDRRFVYVATYNRGERWWSHRLDHEGIWAQIEKRKTAHRERARADAMHSARIRANFFGETSPVLKVL
jgi:hypothetical protein